MIETILYFAIGIGSSGLELKQYKSIDEACKVSHKLKNGHAYRLVLDSVSSSFVKNSYMIPTFRQEIIYCQKTK